MPIQSFLIPLISLDLTNFFVPDSLAKCSKSTTQLMIQFTIIMYTYHLATKLLGLSIFQR